MSRVNEKHVLVQYELCGCKCRLNGNLCNSKQIWYHDKCWCECKELVDWSSCGEVTCGILVYWIINVKKRVKLMTI